MIKSHTLSKAPQVDRALQRYFGIDLARLPQMSDQELAQIADRAIAMKRFVEVLPILEEHFESLIQGQLALEEFTQRVLKSGEKAGAKIDKTLIDAFLLERGYNQKQQLLQQRLGHETQKQNAEHQNQLKLNELDFKGCLELIHRRHQQQLRQVQEKVPNALQQMAIAEQQRALGEQERQRTIRRKELLTHGTQGDPKRRAGGKILSFFTGA